MNRKQILIELGAERLAEHSQTTADRIDYITSSRRENLDRFEWQLDELCDGTFYDWDSVDAYADQLSELLSNLKASIDDSCEGIKWVRQFFERDNSIMESCDDSGGTVGMVFTVDATGCFVHFANNCEHKEFVAHQLLELVLDNQYGVRDQLIERTSDFLPEQWLRWLVEQLQPGDEEDSGGVTERTFLLQSLAKQLKDARLFEAVTLLHRALSFNSCLDIAQVYLENGDATRAQAWAERANLEFPSQIGFRHYDYQTIRREIYCQLGDSEGEERMAWEIFRSNRSVESLAELLQTLGEEQREAVVTQETTLILASSQNNLIESDAAFLLQLGNIVVAKQYLMKRVALLNDVDYITLTEWVGQFAESPLLASLIYRDLLDDILLRGYTKAYHHGVDYWIQLQQLSLQASDWKPNLTHQQYQQHVHQEHGRKYSFWKQVSERGG
jgi:hypothetical protein